MAARQFMVMLTTVRPLLPGGLPRDEQTWPEDRREVVGPADPEDPEAAQRIFAAFGSLPQVRAGRQRAKIVPLAGSDSRQAEWAAPLVTRATPELVGAGR